MTKSSRAYLLRVVAVIGSIYLAVLVYFKTIRGTNTFLVSMFGNFLLIFFLIVLLTGLLDLGSYRDRLIKRRIDVLQDFLRILGTMMIIILIVSFVEYFLFFGTKIGRVIYVGIYFFLCAFFIVESTLHYMMTRKSHEKILWVSAVPAGDIQSEYLDRLSDVEINNDMNEKDGYDLVIYDYPPREGEDAKRLLHTIIAAKKPVDLVSFIVQHTGRIPLRYVDELWLLKNITTYVSVYDKLKRFSNVLISILLLLILFPPSMLFALLQRVTSEGDIFYVQKRVGYKGREFNLIKFRTMVHDAEKHGPRFAQENDPRVTKIGRIMRNCRIDEVPQLINVLKGDMSLIGPRPERGEFIEKLEKEIPFYRLRLEIDPGLTGWAQVNYPYAGADIKDHLRKLELDLYYIKNRNLTLDIMILLKTVRTMIFRKGT
ncbi:MAG: sugar transferase [Spirochaetes bacterium]|nr:sugar transferase [Spirochaetota bacterium]